jgi:predicted phage terminase large subunit-like protein
MLRSPSELVLDLFKKTILENRWIPESHRPTAKQAEFLMSPQLEVLYGGAAGGGKTDGLLMAALQFADMPGYNAILFRRTLQDHKLPEGLIPRSMEWLTDKGAKWNGSDYKWTFPSGATLTFGYLETEQDKYRYQSSAFQSIGWDELTQFQESQYAYLMCRLRRLTNVHVPLRVRSATNPGGIGHEWVKQRFIVEGQKYNRAFIPALLEDNPHIDRTTYEKNLQLLDHATFRQLRHGDWEIRPDVGKFRREWFTIVDGYPAEAKKVRFWDLASTLPKTGTDPDWTAGALMAEKDGVYYLVDIQRRRGTPQQVEQLIRMTAEMDGPSVDICMEEEPGSSGVAMIDHYAREVLKGKTFRGIRTTGDKEIRANPVSSAAEAGNVKLVRGTWINDFLDEAEIFPRGSHDDQVDAVAAGFSMLAVKTELTERPFA